MNIKFVVILLFITTLLQANDEKNWEIEGGLKVHIINEQTSDYLYYNPFTDLTYTFDGFEIEALYSPYIDYKVINGTGLYEYINIHRMGMGLLIPYSDKFEVSTEYFYQVGEMDFIGHDISIDITCFINAISFLGAYNGQFNEFDFNGKIKSKVNSFEGGAGYDMSDRLNVEATFEQVRTEYDSTAVTYVQNMFRFGASYITVFKDNSIKSIILLGGITIGQDSDDYFLYGADFGGLVKIFNNVKIKANYLFKQYYSNETVSRHNSQKSKNPDLTELVDSYTTHKFMAGASLYF